MPLDNNLTTIADGILFVFKIIFVFLTALYFIFSLIIVRQVKLMTETLITEVSPVLRVFTILHAVAALGLIIFFILF